MPSNAISAAGSVRFGQFGISADEEKETAPAPAPAAQAAPAAAPSVPQQAPVQVASAPVQSQTAPQQASAPAAVQKPAPQQQQAPVQQQPQAIGGAARAPAPAQRDVPAQQAPPSQYQQQAQQPQQQPQQQTQQQQGGYPGYQQQQPQQPAGLPNQPSNRLPAVAPLIPQMAPVLQPQLGASGFGMGHMQSLPTDYNNIYSNDQQRMMGYYNDPSQYGQASVNQKYGSQGGDLQGTAAGPGQNSPQQNQQAQQQAAAQQQYPMAPYGFFPYYLPNQYQNMGYSSGYQPFVNKSMYPTAYPTGPSQTNQTGGKQGSNLSGAAAGYNSYSAAQPHLYHQGMSYDDLSSGLSGAGGVGIGIGGGAGGIGNGGIGGAQEYGSLPPPTCTASRSSRVVSVVSVSAVLAPKVDPNRVDRVVPKVRRVRVALESRVVEVREVFKDEGLADTTSTIREGSKRVACHRVQVVTKEALVAKLLLEDHPVVLDRSRDLFRVLVLVLKVVLEVRVSLELERLERLLALLLVLVLDLVAWLHLTMDSSLLDLTLSTRDTPSSTCNQPTKPVDTDVRAVKLNTGAAVNR
ncbi:hypothetical protein BC829DRAFT_383484, partial [Chytridium lagenaria]